MVLQDMQDSDSVSSAIFEEIMGECPYKSPTDMGVNMAGNCIIDDEACKEASRQECREQHFTHDRISDQSEKTVRKCARNSRTP